MSLYEEKREALAQVRAMREWILRLEHILDSSWAKSPEEISNAEIARRFDEWRKRLSSFLQAEGRTQEEQLRLGHLLKVMTHLRPGLVQCYDLPGFPRTTNDMEISIRALKTRYRRISGRKNWNAYTARGLVVVSATLSGGCNSPMGQPECSLACGRRLLICGDQFGTRHGIGIASR